MRRGTPHYEAASTVVVHHRHELCDHARGCSFVLLLPLPLPKSWMYLGISAVLQVVYSIFLARAYRYGELGQVYPIVRGSVPLMVSIGGFVLAVSD